MKSRIRKIVWLTISVALTIIMACILLMIIPMIISEPLARALAPPEYPNSILVEDWVSGGTDSMWDRKLYSTPDSPEQVLTFMESHVGEFKTREHSETERIRFSWGKCSRNVLLSFMVFVVETRPCASVSILTDPDRPDVTLIRVWTGWPAP
jgi:hypothetical protein